MHYSVQRQQIKLLTLAHAVYTQVTHHPHSERWSIHNTIRFRPDPPADIRPHPVLAGFQKFDFGTSPRLTEICHYIRQTIRRLSIQLCNIETWPTFTCNCNQPIALLWLYQI